MIARLKYNFDSIPVEVFLALWVCSVGFIVTSGVKGAVGGVHGKILSACLGGILYNTESILVSVIVEPSSENSEVVSW